MTYRQNLWVRGEWNIVMNEEIILAKKKLQQQKNRNQNTHIELKNHFIFGCFYWCSLSLSLSCVLSFPFLPNFVHDFIEFTRDEIFKIAMVYASSMTFTIYVDGINLLLTIIYFIFIWLLVSPKHRVDSFVQIIINNDQKQKPS